MPRVITVEETGRDYFLDDDDTITDDNGTLWFADGYITLEGKGDTFGPNHPNPPSIVKAIRKEKRQAALAARDAALNETG
jgi:hypothetical protein